MSFRQYGGLQFACRNNYNNLINLTSQTDLPRTLGTPNTTITVLSSLSSINVIGSANFNGQATFEGQTAFNGQTIFNGQIVFNSPIMITYPLTLTNLTVDTLTANTLNISDLYVFNCPSIFNNTMSISNGTTTSVLDMTCSNNLTIANLANNGSVFLNINNSTGQICNSVSITSSGGLSSGTSSGSINNFTAFSSSTPAVMYMGLATSTTGVYNPIIAANDCYIAGTNSSNTGVLTLTTQSTGTCGIRITNNIITQTASTIGINATNTGGLTSTTPQPGPTDSSTCIPTTAWVQSSITAGGGNTLAYYRTGLIAGNQSPLTTPLVISVNTGALTGTNITMCPLVFRMTCNYTNGTTSANQLDSGNVSTFSRTCSCIFNYFVFCSQPVVSGTNANYFTNGIGSATTNTAYYTPSVYGTYGRPFWTSALSDDSTVSSFFPFTFTGVPLTNGVKTMVFNPPQVGYPANSTFYWEWTIEVLNKANFAGMITSTGFNVNLNC
jgi:hypothetical protein